MGMNGYNAQGTATLFFDQDNDLILRLESDFETEFALGTFMVVSTGSNKLDLFANAQKEQVKSTNEATEEMPVTRFSTEGTPKKQNKYELSRDESPVSTVTRVTRINTDIFQRKVAKRLIDPVHSVVKPVVYCRSSNNINKNQIQVT